MTGEPADGMIGAEIDSGLALLVPDPRRPRSYLLMVNGYGQSYVDLDDPTYMGFRYMRTIATTVDMLAPPGAPLQVLHLGGGALTLPRYLAATRPGSIQRVVDLDARLMELIRHQLPWSDDQRLRVDVGDAREVLTGESDASYDVVILDAFVGIDSPQHLTSVEFAKTVARVLRPSGWYLVNLVHYRMLQRIRDRVATVRAVLPHTCLMTEESVLYEAGSGNVVQLAGRAEPPVAGLARWAAAEWPGSRVLAGDELDQFTVGAQMVFDATALPSTPPPPGLIPSSV